MNIGIIGPGGIAGDQHAPAIAAQPGARLWSVLSRDASRGAAFAERHGLAASQPAHTDLRAMLADPDLDAVLIATPDRLHRAQAVAAAQAGKHILLEKPMATSTEEAQDIRDACDTSGVTLGMAYHMRWHQGHRALHDLVQSGGLGTLRHMRIQWTFEAPNGGNWRAQPETGRWWSLAANGTHCIDQIRWMLRPSCGEITEIRSLFSHAKFNSRHDESAMALFRFESGATAELAVSVQFPSPSRLEIYGDAGWARCEDTMGRHGAGTIETHTGELPFIVQRPFVGLWNDFLQGVATGRPPEVSTQEAIANVQVMELVTRNNVDTPRV